MIFKQWKQVLSGQKTQTRRPVKDGDEASYQWLLGGQRGPLLSIQRNGRLWLKVGGSYAIQPGRGEKAVGRIRIAGLRRERVQDISGEDAKAEGAGAMVKYSPGLHHYSLGYRNGFKVLWDSIYKKAPHRWENNPEVWVVEFEVEETNGANT